MRRAIAILMLAAGALLLVQGVGTAKPGTGQGPCHHGGSNKPCRPDPQPSHGKDCLHHGGNGKNSHANPTGNGHGNQDHCLPGTSTPTPTPSPTSTVQGVTFHSSGTNVKGVSLAKTGAGAKSEAAGLALLLLGAGLTLSTFGKKEALQKS